MDHVAIQNELRGRYRIERELGRGGMGVVYQAFQDSQQRRVALKLVSTAQVDDLDWAARLAQEARLAARVAHANVVRVYEFDRLGDQWAMIAFELVEGESLRSLLEHESPLAPARAREIGAGLAAGLDAIHAAGILHRDLKPENVLLSEHGPKITDLGIAKDLSADRVKTSSGLMLGTPPYMAPEHIQGAALTGAVDVYALGCVLFEMVTGRLPFEERQVAELLLAHVNREPPNPSDLKGGIPPELSALILSCLAKRPADRPSAAELAVRLAPGDAGPPSPPPVLRAAPVRRDPAASSSSLTLPLQSSVVKATTVALAPPRARPWRWRLGALAAGGALAAVVLTVGAPAPRGRLALPAETVSRAAAGLDRARRDALPALLERLSRLLADPLATDLRALCQGLSDKSNGAPGAPQGDPIYAFWSKAEHAAAVQALVHRASDLALAISERYGPAELGLDKLRQVADGLVLRIQLDRLWTLLLDDAALIEALAHQRPVLAKMTSILKRPEPARLATDMKTMRTLLFNCASPPVEPALRVLFQELELAAARSLPDFERFQTCWRVLALIRDVSTVDCSAETVRDAFVDRVRPSAEALRREPLAAALVDAIAACRNPHAGFAGASAAFGKALPPPPAGRFQPPMWQALQDLARLVPYPWVFPRALERRGAM